MKATLKVLGRTYQSKGRTAKELFGNFKIGGSMKGAGVLSVEQKGVKREKILSGRILHKLFDRYSSPTMKMIAMKQIKPFFGL